MRKLVTIRKVKALEPIPNADRIEKAIIDGWKCVVGKGQYQVGDYGVYFEIDSFLPASDERFAFLAKNGTKTIGDFEGIRIRTQTFRGELSQGLLLPVNQFPEVERHLGSLQMTLADATGNGVTGAVVDLTNVIGVIKYERPEPQMPDAAGDFPYFIKVTDEERIQNLYDTISVEKRDVLYYPTLKLDGTSCTIATVTEKYQGFYNGKEDAVRSFEFNGETIHIMVCSRNLQIKTGCESHYRAALERMGMFEKIEALHRYFQRPIAVQGEVIGYGIQGNPERLPNQEFHAFNMFDIDDNEYMPYSVVKDVFTEFEVVQVPQVAEPFKPFQRFDSIEELLAFSDGPSLKALVREGIVYKSDYHGSFKVINDRWLLIDGNA